MGITKIIAIIGLSFAAATVQAGTNSWTYTGANVNNYHWDATGSWSLGAAPTINDYQDYITNSTTKTVVINASDAALEQSELTISNLTVSGVGGVINSLSLSNMNFGALVPLHVLNGLTIGAGGVLNVTNSMLQVDGALLVNGTAQFFNLSTVHASNATFNSSAVMSFALGTNTNTVVVGNALTLGVTINVTKGSGFTNTTYTIFTYTGLFTSNALAIGTVPTNSTCVIDSSIAGQVNLTVSLTSSPPPSGVFQITSIARTNNDIVIGWTAVSTGTNAVQATSGAGDGSYNTNNFSDISGPILVTGGANNIYTESSGSTNAPSRFYRIRIVP